MNESIEQYLRLAVERKCRVLSGMFETCTRDEQRSNNPPEIDLKLSAIAKALARGLQVVEAHAGSVEPSDLGVLQSFNETVFSDGVADVNSAPLDSAKVARTHYLHVVRRQNIRFRAAALEAGHGLVSTELPSFTPNDQTTSTQRPANLSPDYANYLLCLADLSTDAEMEKARLRLGDHVKIAFSNVPYKHLCTAYQWLGFAAVAPAPYSDIANDIALQVLFQPSVLRRALDEAPWLMLQQLFIYLYVNPSEAVFSYAEVLLLELLVTEARLSTFSAPETTLPGVLMSIDVCCRALRAGEALRHRLAEGPAASLPFLRASAVAKLTSGEFDPPITQDYAYPELTFSLSHLKRTGIFVCKDDHWGFEPSTESEVNRALGKGASLVITSDQTRAAKGQYLEVRNTFTALVKLALARRAAFRGRVIGVTGSVGKSTVCSMVTALLEAHGSVYKNIANFNHQPGVPKSTANIPRGARYAVIEMGMGAKRTILPKAVTVRPHTAVVTDIQADHMEFHESVASVVTTKMEIIWGLESGGTVLLNRDSAHFPTMHGLALQRPDINILTFGEHAQADICAEDIALGPSHSMLRVRVFQKCVHYTVALPGVHMALNSLVAVAVLVSEGVDLAQALPAFEKIVSEKRRNQKLQGILANGTHIQILDDSFNTNPASVRSNLHVLGLMQPESDGRRILVLSDMGEMGEEALHYHTALAQDINDSRIAMFLSIGDHCKALDQLIDDRITHQHFESVTSLEKFLQAALRSGDIISFKGSARKATMVELVKSFTDGKSTQKEPTTTPTLVEFFNRRFKENAYNLTKISEQEKEAIGYLVQQTLALGTRTSNALWLIDYGCGDGRLQPFYNLLAETFSAKEFHILGVDFAVEALRAYRTNCLQEGFEETNLALQAGGVSGHKQLAPLKRDNITVHFLEGGIEALQKMVCPPDQRFEIVVAAGVLCRVLGDHCRREMIEAFSRVADSAFVSMPTQDEFKSIQSEFNELRRERSQLLAQINDRHNNLDHESAQLRLVAIKDILKDAHGEGEIYYSAKRVRGFGEKIPDLKDHKIPYFLATPAQAQEVMDYGAYSSTSVTHGAFGGHSRWMICLGSQSFSVDSMENNSA